MDRGQGPAGRGSPRQGLTGTLSVKINDLAQARAVLALDCPEGVTLVTAPGLAAFAGVGFWHAVEEALGHAVVIDCGEDAGLALAALRAGCRDLLFTGEAEIAARLADMAGQVGARLHRRLEGEVRTLLPEDDPGIVLGGRTS